LQPARVADRIRGLLMSPGQHEWAADAGGGREAGGAATSTGRRCRSRPPGGRHRDINGPQMSFTATRRAAPRHQRAADVGGGSTESGGATSMGRRCVHRADCGG